MNDTTHDVLVVGDSTAGALQIDTLLAAAGFSVRLAADGAEALAMARRKRPDAILSDIAMPVLDGFEMCRRVKADDALHDVPVILLTPLSSLDDIVQGLQSGADNLIRKPFDMEDLVAKLRHVIDTRLSQGQRRVQMGVRIQLGGTTHFIDAERQQILDLLVSTYEEAARMTEQLRIQQQDLAGSYQWLERLCRIGSAIAPALHPREVARLALEELLSLPGVTGGAVVLSGADGALRFAATTLLGDDRGLCVQRQGCACRAALGNVARRSTRVPGQCTLLGDALQAGAGMVVPLFVGDRTLGAILLATNDLHGDGAASRQVIETAAQQVAVAIERSQLYCDMETLVRERTRALQSERHLTSQIVRTTAALVMLADEEGKIVLFNPACEAAFGWSEAEVVGKFFADVLVDPARAADVRHALNNLSRSGGQGFPYEHWRARDGSELRIIWTVSAVQGADGKHAYWLGTGLDVTEAEGLRERLRYLSNFDTATGLPNRASLRERFGKTLDGARQGSAAGLLWIWCERLPLVRESLGPAAEQSLVTAMAARLKRWQRDGDCVARCDDGAFAVVAVRAGPDELATPAAEILALMAPPFQVGQEALHVEVSVGIAVAPPDEADFDTLVQAASAASRQASMSEEPRFIFHQPERLVAASERFRLEVALRQALERNELFLQYQPQASLSTGRMVGFEALLRWRHPALGMVSPAHFIDIAEETGLIHPIGDWVLRQACLQLRDWRAQGLALVPIAVNLSAKQFSSRIVDRVRAVLEETGVDPSHLVLELTESVSMDDPESTFGILAALRSVGVQLAIDDFGTGYSNLNYLKRFPVQKLKLDQSFVRELVSSPHDLAISRAVIAMAHSLRLCVIAEGVETAGQLALLSANGCDEMQGYLFSRPLDPGAAAALLRDGASLDLEYLSRKRAGFAVLCIGAGTLCARESVAAALRDAGANPAHLQVAEDPAQAFELMARTDFAMLVALGCNEAPWGTMLEVARQLHPAVALLAIDGDVAAHDVRERLRTTFAQAMPRSIASRERTCTQEGCPGICEEPA
jgi:PAS domain S-box-containing protein/diguanylate cyclase (GGDEF)-like protein